jgi:hypothetical protein
VWTVRTVWTVWTVDSGQWTVWTVWAVWTVWRVWTVCSVESVDSGQCRECGPACGLQSATHVCNSATHVCNSCLQLTSATHVCNLQSHGAGRAEAEGAQRCVLRSGDDRVGPPVLRLLPRPSCPYCDSSPGTRFDRPIRPVQIGAVDSWGENCFNEYVWPRRQVHPKVQGTDYITGSIFYCAPGNPDKQPVH